jgi:hypothetical protein
MKRFMQTIVINTDKKWPSGDLDPYLTWTSCIAITGDNPWFEISGREQHDEDREGGENNAN